MPTFVISGKFWATDIDDATNFLARYFVGLRDGEPPYDRALLIEVKSTEDD